MRAAYVIGMVLGLAVLPLAGQAAEHATATPPSSAALPSRAATVSTDQEYLALVADANSGKDVDWQKLRDLYTRTSFYDPYGGAQEIWYLLQRAGQQVVYDQSPEAMQEYNTLLDQHFAHFRSHMQALDMIDKGHLPQGDRAFHQKALSAITRAILATGDGKSPETAYHVIDPAEETMLLKTYFHYNVEGQEFRQNSGHFWDVLNYKDAGGNHGSVFFNVDQILTAPSHSGRG